MGTALDVERIKGENGLEIRVVLAENILTDDTPEEPSRTYDVETHFYDLASVAPELSLIDTSPTDFNEANKLFRAVVMAMSIFSESQVI